MSTPVLLTPKEAAAFLKVSEKTLEGWRGKGTGPTFRRLGRRMVRYALADLEAWMRGSAKAGGALIEQAQP